MNAALKVSIQRTQCAIWTTHWHVFLVPMHNKQYIAFKKMTRAALIIQSQYRTYREHERFKKSRRAAAIIQNSFRSYRERRRSSQRRREQRLCKRQEARFIQLASNRSVKWDTRYLISHLTLVHPLAVSCKFRIRVPPHYGQWDWAWSLTTSLLIGRQPNSLTRDCSCFMQNHGSPKEHNGCLPVTKKSGNFGWNVNGKPILVFPNGSFRRKRDFSKGSPKFPNGISKRKTCLSFSFLHDFATLQTLSVNVNEFCKWYTPIPTKFPIREFFAYHLNKPSTNRFLLVNGK